MPLFKHLKGIHVDHNKNTRDFLPEIMPVPERVYISMVQHIGAPCAPLVAVGEFVGVGQKIGDTSAYVSAPIHSSVSGRVVSIEGIMSSLGTMDTTVVIETDGLQKHWEGLSIPAPQTREEFINIVRDSGLVGLGGAAFPTHVKYAPENPENVHTLVINGAECEPYITSDYRTMVDSPTDIVSGIKLVMGFLNLNQCFIGIEGNKPEAIQLLTELTTDHPEISVVTLQEKYPQGAERVLIFETTGKILPPGKLPAEIGVLVSNITSVAFIGQYFSSGMPLVSKCITVDGSAVTTPKNLIVPIGTRICDIISYCGGYKSQPRKILMGGPMMGRAIYDDRKALIKNNNAILAFDEKEAQLSKETSCIHCGRCVSVCPVHLMPIFINEAYYHGEVERLIQLKVTGCMECGCCSYVCPSKRQLNIVHKLAKIMVREAGK